MPTLSAQPRQHRLKGGLRQLAGPLRHQAAGRIEEQRRRITRLLECRACLTPFIDGDVVHREALSAQPLRDMGRVLALVDEHEAHVGAIALRVRHAGVTEVGRVAHPGRPGVEPVGSPGTPIGRSLVVGDTIYTISAVGVKASALGTFADRGFVRLPFDEVVGGPPRR